MITPLLYRDQNVLHLPPMHLNGSNVPTPQQWRPPTLDHRFLANHELKCRNSVAVSVSAGPVLPRIASLLHGVETRDMQVFNKRKRQAEDMRRKDLNVDESYHEGIRVQCPSSSAVVWKSNHHSQRFAVPTTRIPDDWPVYHSDMASPQLPLDLRSQVRPTAIDISSRSITQGQTPLNSLDTAPSYRLSHDPSGRRRLFDDHNIDSREIHSPIATTETPHRFHHGLFRRYMKSGKFDDQSSLSQMHVGFLNRHVEDATDMSVKKRRREVSPMPVPHEPRYEPEYGQNVLRTVRPLTDSRCNPITKFGTEDKVSTSRRRYVRGNSSDMESHDFPIATNTRLTSRGNDRVGGPTATKSKNTPAPSFCEQTSVEDCETFPNTTLALKSKDLFHSDRVVRNRHDEINWVATFLSIGFESSSIYALMCPLRKGRWKPEEEKYTLGLLRLIESGTILLRHGQSIRGYIGKKLHSDDMRVLKKLSNCKMFRFAKLINPRLAEEAKVDMSVAGAREGLERLEQLKSDFLRSVQLEALVAVRKHLSNSSLPTC